MLTIDRLHIDLRATAAAERGEVVKRRVADTVPAGIARALRGLPDGRDEALQFIERLEVECAVATDSDDDALVAAVAQAFLAAYGRAVATARGRRFDDWHDYLAQFWIALADDGLASAWWFDEFEGLRLLPASGALRTSILQAGAQALTVFQRMTPSTAQRVLAILNSADAERVAAAWSALGTGTAPRWRDVTTAARLASKACDKLAAVLAMHRLDANVAPARVLRAIAQWRAVVQAARVHGVVAPGAPAAEAWCRRLQDAGLDAADAARTPAWAPLDDDDLAQAVALLAEVAANAENRADGVGAPIEATTPFGGVFVLLKVIEWLGWCARWRGVLTSDVDLRRLALVVAARALRERATAQVLRDPALLRALALPALHPDHVEERALRRDLRRALRASGHATLRGAVAALLAGLSARVPGLAGATPGYLRAQLLSMPAQVIDDPAGALRLQLGSAPLDPLLKIAGLARGTIKLPGRALRYEGVRP